MSETSSNNQRIAKNTLFLYLRMLLVLGVSLYTSRVVLKTLGIEDFGIYNVIGGLATSFVFFSSSLSNATQRFLNFELGKRNIEKVQEIFNLNLLIYSIIAILVVIIAELVGIWLIANKLTIPTDRIDAAYWIFHVVIISLAITLIGTVFDSVLIARENMKIYAYMGIYDALGRLAIVFMLNWFSYDKLKLYALLLFFISLTAKCIPAILCIKKYPECKIKFYWNKELFINMFKFVGWNGFGTAVWAINEQGMNILLNIFFGPTVNAARGIASQVNSTINNFKNNFFVAVRPQIVKSYASGNYDYFIKLILCSSKYSFFLMWILCLPIILRVDYILQWWLGNVPSYTEAFIQWILVYSLVNVLTIPFWNAIQAIGKLQRYIMIGSSIYLMAFPISYFFLRLGYNPVITFQVLVIVRLLYLFVSILIIKQYIKLSMIDYLKTVIIPITLVCITSAPVMIGINTLFEHDFISLIIISSICIFITFVFIFHIGLNKVEKEFVINKIKEFICTLKLKLK